MVVFLPLFDLLCPRKDKGVLRTVAEIIPYEPDPVSTGEGIVWNFLPCFSFFRQHPSLYLLSSLLRTFLAKREMKVQVNNKEVETTATNIALLAEQLQLPTVGIAIAVNNQMVPRTEWDTHSLKENDALVVIKAACGG